MAERWDHRTDGLGIPLVIGRVEGIRVGELPLIIHPPFTEVRETRSPADLRLADLEKRITGLLEANNVLVAEKRAALLRAEEAEALVSALNASLIALTRSAI